MEERPLRIGMSLLLALLSVTLASPAFPAGADDGVVWEKKAKTFYSAERLPRDTEIRIRVVKYGKATLSLVEWVGQKKDKWRELQAWDGRSLRKGGVMRYRLPSAMAIGVRVASKKDAKVPHGLTPAFGYHRMQFGEGWVLDVKVVDPEF
jgi:hypothetical protein